MKANAALRGVGFENRCEMVESQGHGRCSCVVSWTVSGASPQIRFRSAVRERLASSPAGEGRRALLKLVRVGWGQDNPAFRQVLTSLMIPGGTLEQSQWVNDLQRVSTSPANAARLLQVFGDIDVAHLLPRVAAPTLVLHSRGDAPCPFEQGLMLARGIPNARFVALESRNNVILSHEPAWQRFVDKVCAFLDENGGSISA
jgi:pimeloyl-ACP methyl ester carboxylesterase